MAKINYPPPVVLQPFSQSALYWQQAGRRTSSSPASLTPEPDWEALVQGMLPDFWLRADDGIVDISGNDVEVNAIGTVTDTGDTVNSHKSFRLNGTNNAIQAGRVNINTIVCVFKDFDSAQPILHVPRGNGGSTDKFFSSGIQFNSDRYRCYPTGALSADVLKTQISTGFNTLTARNGLELINNGVRRRNGTNTALPTSTATYMHFGVYARGAGDDPQLWKEMDLAECIIFSSAITDDQWYTLQAYLEDRYALVPENVTYKYKPVTFTKSVSNPIIDGSGANDYPPAVVKLGTGSYLMFTKGVNNAKIKNHLGTTPESWTSDNAINIFDGDSADRLWFDGTTYYVWGDLNDGGGRDLTFNSSTSRDSGFAETEAITTATVNAALSKSYLQLAISSIWKEGTANYCIFYATVSSGNPNFNDVVYAENPSGDLTTWTNFEIILQNGDLFLPASTQSQNLDAISPNFSGHMAISMCQKVGSRYEALVVTGRNEALTGANNKMLYPAYSTDGKNWKVCGRPLIPCGGSSTWDEGAAYSGNMLKEGDGRLLTPVTEDGKHYIYYSGYENPGTNFRVGVGSIPAGSLIEYQSV